MESEKSITKGSPALHSVSTDTRAAFDGLEAVPWDNCGIFYSSSQSAHQRAQWPRTEREHAKMMWEACARCRESREHAGRSPGGKSSPWTWKLPR